MHGKREENEVKSTGEGKRQRRGAAASETGENKYESKIQLNVHLQK